MKTKTISNLYRYLPTGGFCGSTLRQINWKNTTLGPAELWPSSLKTAIHVSLNSPLGSIVWWGKRLLMVYNDPCMSILAERHPSSFGKPLRLAWPEANAQLSKVLEEVFVTGEARSTEDQLIVVKRNGKEEEAYFSMSHCPILNDEGEVEGIFTTIIEKTEVVVEKILNRIISNMNKSLIEATSTHDVFQHASRIFQENQHHFPFTIFYELGATCAIRASISGKVVSDELAPAKLDLSEDRTVWPLKTVMGANDFLIENIGDLPMTSRAKPRGKVLLFPIKIGAENLPKAVLVIGINPRCAAIQSQINSIHLIVEQISDRLNALEKQNQWIRYANEQSIKANQELEQLRFISNHNLQEPLRKIRTFAKVLAETHNIEDQKKYLSKIDNSAAHMSQLIQELIHYADLSAPTSQAQSVDLTDMLEDAINILGNEIAEKKAVIKFEKLPNVMGDKSQLVQLFQCLLQNSLKFTTETPVINIRYRKIKFDGSPGTSMYNEITFSDNGIGLNPLHVHKAFQLFQKLHDKDFPGNGTGLTVCKKIVENHHGMISVLCEADKGTTVRILIPTE